MKVGLRARLASYANGRTKEWNQASIDWKRANPRCAVCDHKAPNEAHDKLPYHKLTDTQKHDYTWLMKKNLVTVCDNCHAWLAHCGDPSCYQYNPKIEQIAVAVAKFDKYCTT